jgi:hypothetical protein
MEELNGLEKLAVMQAMMKAIGEQVSTKNPDGLRYACDQRVTEAYEKQGIKSIDVRVQGEKVGTYTVRTSKPAKPREDVEIEILDVAEFGAWLKDNSGELQDYLTLHGSQVAQFMFDAWGIIPDGCNAIRVTIPGHGEQAEGTTLKVDPRKVAHALQGTLPERIAGMLEGGKA